MKKLSQLLTVVLLLTGVGCSSNPNDSSNSSTHNHQFHNGHYHISEINHTHTDSYNTPCADSHGHCN